MPLSGSIVVTSILSIVKKIVWLKKRDLKDNFSFFFCASYSSSQNTYLDFQCMVLIGTDFICCRISGHAIIIVGSSNHEMENSWDVFTTHVQHTYCSPLGGDMQKVPI